MTPLDWAKRPLFKYSDFSGRASRPDYWWFILANIIAFAVARVIDSALGLNGLLLGVYGPLTAILGLGLLCPSLAVAARRLHDTGRSAWWMLLVVVPVAGLVVIYFLALEGTFGPNEFGSPPVMEPGPVASL